MTSLATPLGAYPHVRISGPFAFVSGTSARQPDNSISGGVAEQTTATLLNIEGILGTIGLDRTDLVDAMSFLIDMDDFPEYNRAWATFFDGQEPPARTTVAVRDLPGDDLLVEIKAVAALREDHP